MKKLKVYTKIVGGEEHIAVTHQKDEKYIRVVLKGEKSNNSLLVLEDALRTGWEEYSEDMSNSVDEAIAKLENQKDSAWDTLHKLESLLEKWKENEKVK